MYKLYIGANNQTGKVEVDKITSTLDKYFKGYTVYKAQGRWNGKNENSIIVEIEAVTNKVDKVVTELKDNLKQEAIGVLRTEETIDFV